MREKHLPAQVLQQLGALQAVHHRALHFRQMQRDAGVAQAGVDGLQALQRAGVAVVDGLALQHHVLERRALGHRLVQAVFQHAPERVY